MNAVRNNRAANNVAPNYDNLANNLTLSQFSSWARTGSGAIKDRRLVLNETRILNGNAEPRQVGPAQRRLPQPPGGGAMLTSRTTDGSDDHSKAQNKTARQVFLRVILRECGVKDMKDLPYDVKCAMRLKKSWLHHKYDWDAGTTVSLSARRVAAVSRAVTAYKDGLNAKLSQLGVAQAGEDWLANPDHGEFWKGLSNDFKAKLLSLPRPAGEGSRHPITLLFQEYSRQGTAHPNKQEFLRVINAAYKTGTIPIGEISVPLQARGPKDPVGSYIRKQMESNRINYESDLEARGFGTMIGAALAGLAKTQSTLEITWRDADQQEHKITLRGTALENGGIRMQEDNGPERAIPDDNAFFELQQRLCGITGLSNKELCVMLNKASAVRTPEGTDFLALQTKGMGMCSNPSRTRYRGIDKTKTTINVTGNRNCKIKQNRYGVLEGFTGFLDRHLDKCVQIHFDNNQLMHFGDFRNPTNAELFPNNYNLEFQCDYVVPGTARNGRAQSPTVSNLKYGMKANMKQFAAMLLPRA